MKRIVFLIPFLLLTLCLRAQADPHCLKLMGVPIEGPVDSVRQELSTRGFTAWGESDDGEDLYFRGQFYGIRAKLIVTQSLDTHLVTSAYITVGPYSTEAMLTRNQQYFLRKLQQEHGEFTQRNDAYYFMDDFGSIKLSIADNDNGSRDIRVLYFPGTAFYKDAVCAGFRGNVQEVVTENAVAEEQFLHYQQNGQVENPDLIHREYNRYGYLVRAQMTEKTGHSQVHYDYDDDYRLKRRIVTSADSTITYVNEYTYNGQGDIATQQQKVYDEHKECILSINMHNNYLTRDDQGNWTSNSLVLSYWEKGQQSQQTTVLQKRTIAYWE